MKQRTPLTSLHNDHFPLAVMATKAAKKQKTKQKQVDKDFEFRFKIVGDSGSRLAARDVLADECCVRRWQICVGSQVYRWPV